MNERKPYFFLQCDHGGKTHPNASENPLSLAAIYEKKPFFKNLGVLQYTTYVWAPKVSRLS